jgi:glutathione S-transferase
MSASLAVDGTLLSMSLRVYGSPITRAHRVLWLLEEAGLAYETVPLNTIEELEAEESFQAVYPDGKVPTLIDGDLVLFESLAINLHLARSRGALAPSTEEAWAKTYQWTLWVANEVEEPVFVTLRNRLILPAPERDAAAAREAEEQLARPLATLERGLTHEHLVAEEFTVADVNVASILVFAVLGQVDLGRLPRVTSWLIRCLERPAARKFFGGAVEQLRG